MRRAHVFLSLALVVVWLWGGAGPVVLPPAAGDSNEGAVEAGQVPVELAPSEWQRIEAQVAKLTADDGMSADLFGTSVAVSGDMAIVGAVYADVDGHSAQGAAYVFYRDRGGPGAWGQVTKLTADDGMAVDLFGQSISVSGDVAVVGAVGADVGGNSDQGAAYVFYRDRNGPDAWGQVAKLTASDGAAGDNFGVSVSVSGDTAVVGAYWATVGGHEYRGAAYVFDRDQGGTDTWGQVFKLTAADGAEGDEFGTSVSLSGDTALVGAPYADAGVGMEDQGAAYVFYRNPGVPEAWDEVARLTSSDGTGGYWFGSGVSVSGDTAVVGAPNADVGSSIGQGAAYVFYRDRDGADAWGQVAKLTAADGAAGDSLGYSVSVSGHTAVAGAHRAGIDSTGAAYVFRRDQAGADAWGQVTKLAAADGASQDWFGYSVSVDQDTAVVGAYHAEIAGNSAQGAAYVYALPYYWIYLPCISRNYGAP